MIGLPHLTLSWRGRKLIGRVAFTFLLLCSIAVGAAAGLVNFAFHSGAAFQ